MISSKIQLESKLQNIGTTIFSVIGQLSAEYKAINLSQGAPNFPCDPKLVSIVTKAMEDNHNQYAPMTGYLPLKKVIAHKIETLYGQHYDAEKEISITASASEAIYSSIAALVHPNDEVIYFEPSFDSYAPIVRLQGGKPVCIKLKPPHFTINWDEVQASLSSRTRMIIINTPHNPSGKILGRHDLNRLSSILKNSNVIVLSDEVYEHVVFDGNLHSSVSTHDELATRSIVVSSFGKSFHVTGWRVGYCVAPENLMREILKVHQFMMFSADTPMQYAFADYMKDPNTYLKLSNFYQKKRDLLVRELRNGPFEIIPSNGSFFLLLSYAHFSQESDMEFVKRLIINFGVATIPLSAFYSDGTDNKIIRVSFSKDEETLLLGAQALNNITF